MEVDLEQVYVHSNLVSFSSCDLSGSTVERDHTRAMCQIEDTFPCRRTVHTVQEARSFLSRGLSGSSVEQWNACLLEFM